MKRLILMRHAKSDWSMQGADHARGLNRRGEKSARAMGDWLRAQGWLPDEVLCSTATRTRQTLDLLALDAPATRFESTLYLAEPQTIANVLRSATGECVLLLAHNSGIASFARAALAEPVDHPRFDDYPTCATLLAEFEIERWEAFRMGTGAARGFAIPREVIAQMQ